uniref:Uncharacterized protein n=1 Tax=Anguilla anguilla TaxID=7936 RepID=A0A0E9TR77_ANGAN
MAIQQVTLHKVMEFGGGGNGTQRGSTFYRKPIFVNVGAKAFSLQ